MDTKIKLLIFLLFTCLSVFGQEPPLNLAVRLQITSAVGSDPYTVTGIVSDDLSRFIADDIQVGDSLYVLDGSFVYVLAITSITSVVGPTIVFVANDPNNAGISLPTGQAAIIRPTLNYKLPTYISGLRDDLRSAIMNRQAQLIDNISGGGVASITDFTSAGENVPPSAAASSNGGETWRNMTTGELWGSNGTNWYPYTRGPKECQDTVLVSAVTIQSGGSLTTGSPLVRNSSGVWEHMYNHPSGLNLIPDGVVTDVISGPRAIIQYCGVRRGSGATPNSSYYVNQSISTGFTTTLPTTNIRPLGKVASNGDFLINAGLLFSRDNLLNSRDSSFAKTNNSYANKRITDNLYKNGTLGIRTIDTTGIISIQLKQNTAPGVSKPGIYYKNTGNNWWICERMQNPSLGWQNQNKGDFYRGVINNGLNGSTNFPPGTISDTLPNIVWREGQNWQQAPALYNSIETNWWGGPAFSGTGARNVYEFHYPQVIDSALFEHRPLTGYYEKRANGEGSLGINVTLLDVKGWRYGQDATFSMNRNSEAYKGQMNIFNDSLYTLNLSDIRQNTVAYFGSANKGGVLNPTGKGNFITIGGNGAFNNVVGMGALYKDSNNGGDLDMLFTTQTGSVQVERMRIKGGGNLVGIATSAPLQTLDVNGTTLHRGSVRVNMVGDSAAMVLKYSSSQTAPIFQLQNNVGADIAYMHVFNPSNNPSLVLGRVSSVATDSPNNLVFGNSQNLSLSSGAGNNAIFNNSGSASNTGYENAFFGIRAGGANTTGFQNFFGGYLAGGANTTGYQLMYLGVRAGAACTTGNTSVAIGANSMLSSTNPSAFVSIGSQSAQSATTTNSSVVIGNYAGGGKTTINGSVLIGDNVCAQSGSVSNQLWVDNSNTNTPLLKGDFANDTLRVFGSLKAGFENYTNTTSLFEIIGNGGKSKFFKSTVSPNGVITGNTSDVALTSISSVGSLWIKKTGTGNTGWEQAVTTSGTSTSISTMMREESFTSTSGQTAFTIAYSAPAVSGTSVPIRVYRNGVRLFWVASGPTITQFTYSGTTVTTAANTAGDIITIEYLN